MKPWLLALLSSRRRLIERTFTANDTVVIPEGVSLVDMTGFGARGTNAETVYVDRYSENRKFQAVRRVDGQLVIIDGGTTTKFGLKPADYCDAFNETPTDPTYSGNRVCYYMTDTSYSYVNPATTGAAGTGLGKSFPGSLGNTTPATTSFANVAVIGGSSNSFIVPSGGSITIKYYQ
jgi:hypothetical protein